MWLSWGEGRRTVDLRFCVENELANRHFITVTGQPFLLHMSNTHGSHIRYPRCKTNINKGTKFLTSWLRSIKPDFVFGTNSYFVDFILVAESFCRPRALQPLRTILGLILPSGNSNFCRFARHSLSIILITVFRVQKRTHTQLQWAPLWTVCICTN